MDFRIFDTLNKKASLIKNQLQYIEYELKLSHPPSIQHFQKILEVIKNNLIIKNNENSN